MDILHSIILGIIEGTTEFLPISSTGHLILASDLLGLEANDFIKSFEISIQAGAILAVVVFYWRQLLLDRDIAKKVAVAFVPTGVIGFVLYKTVKSFLLGSTALVLWALVLGGVVLILFEIWDRGREHGIKGLHAITYKQAFLVGVAQSVSLVPGISRAAATIIGGLGAGLDRKTIVEFSFLLAVPTMLAAGGYDLLQSVHVFSWSDFGLLSVGFAVSFITAIFAVRFFLYYIQRRSFIIFGAYRVVLAFIFWYFIF